ncbi:MAG: class I SAM-dependent methyltransferase [Bacteroidetes bacterium]|nr:class I SAM-dependent methyltransferase [Bacteroidota bacterium]
MRGLVSCSQCDYPDTLHYLDVQDYSVSKELFSLNKCHSCGLIFTVNAPSRDEIGPYYRSDAYVSHTDSSKGLINRLYHLVRRHTIRNKRKMVTQPRKGIPGKLLDYGCGTGAFLYAMRDAGWEVQGLEPDETARANAYRLYALRVEAPESLKDIPDGYFDVITLWHVLEHVHDLKGTLRQLVRILSREGTIFIAVPNPISTDARHYGAHWAAWDVPRHLWHFPPIALQALLARYGLDVVGRKPMWFDSFYVSMLSEQYAYGSSRLLSALWTGLRSNVAAWLNPARCSSLIYIARKK